MTPATAALALDGKEYGFDERAESVQSIFRAMKEHGLVAVYGASDDLAELRGAIDDEVGAPGNIYVTKAGLVVPECDDDDCPHEKRIRENASAITPLWCEEEGISFTYNTPIPHSTFLIKEDGETYCRGIVFALADVPAG